jgi:hypothetical protein
MRSVLLSPAWLAMAAVLVGGPAQAQSSDARWIDNCESNNDNRRETFCDVKVYRMEPRSSLSIDAGMNGGIEVVAWDQTGIEVHARIQASGETMEDARSKAGDIEIDTTSGSLRATGPSSQRNGGWSVSFRVMVPRHMDLEASAHNGPLSVSRISGTINLDVVNGPLELYELAGDVTARAENGPLSVSLAGNHWDGKGLDAETQNGPVTLQIPEGYSAELETGTINGPLDVQFPLTVTLQGRMPRRLRTTMGNGGAPVRAVTTNGPASIQRQ